MFTLIPSCIARLRASAVGIEVGNGQPTSTMRPIGTPTSSPTVVTSALNPRKRRIGRWLIMAGPPPLRWRFQ